MTVLAQIPTGNGVTGPNGQDIRETLNAHLATIILQPDPSGDSGPMINDRLAQLAASGGGSLMLSRGYYRTSTRIVCPTKCGIVAVGKEAAIIEKGSAFPDGDTLLDASGTQGDNTGATHKTGMTFANLQLSAGTGSGVKAGLLLNADFTSTSSYTGIRLRGSPGTAISLAEAWDSEFYSLQANNCGGPLGEADAVMRIMGTSTDKANLLRFYGTRFETLRNMGIYIGDGGFGTNSGPYGILFSGLKLESGILVDNASLFRSTGNCSAIELTGVYLQFQATAARTGIRGINIDGHGCKVGGVQANIGANVSVVSLVKIPRVSGGGRIEGPIRVTGNSTLSMILEADALNEAGNNAVYNERAMQIGTVVPFGSVPLIGSTGAGTPGVNSQGEAGVDRAGYTFPQLDGTVSRTATGDTTVRRSDLNRILAINSTTARTATIPPEGDRFGSIGDVITVTQEGSAAVTLAGFTGGTSVTLQLPNNTAALATTTGPFTQVRARKVASNTWRIF